MPSPERLFGDLFHDVQLSGLFADSKTFVDCTPKQAPEAILAAYHTERTQPDFDLDTFVNQQFDRPSAVASGYVSDTSVPTQEHINRLWPHLTRAADVPVANSSRVALPHPYVVPGGRFREIFYWDSYFTMLGLREAGRTDLIRGMLDNFAYLIDTVGFIPNGNRTYFLSRSQPPFFALMVGILADIDGPGVLATYLTQLQKEYDFWMTDVSQLSADKPQSRRVVRLPDGTVLNRYWDELATPRPEAYRQELELTPAAEQRGIDPGVMYKHIRAACESGWDFSSRWLADRHSLVTIHATDIVPVDLNCLLYTLEQTLQQAYKQVGNQERANAFEQLADQRKAAILGTFWNDETGFFHDYDVVAGKQTTALTLAGAFPLFMKLATPDQASRVHDCLKTEFLQPGGWVTTLQKTGQQWDWPNGWAPLQWIVYDGLLTYGFSETTNQGRDRWLALNDKVFKATGKLMEKYNVVDAALTTGGGEYPNQDGFGWTNGVYLAMVTKRG
ncbi:alpha,alpha-trehalase TreA [Fibrivirga algicola]|uniref:Alpha,alpha-trehalase TreA n=1 Tax=Fibrivirga algicola TaxID=2950420 RepID=A0ABX0QJ19_9BACT|nr:alpha,alpha-trehalase TreA [Fibrivirga algicola]NID10653.1 alpha,alpha-trehalase TreA [Fibrivirga algicola]